MEERRGGPVLEETFYIFSKKKTIYRVKLTEKGLSLQKENNGNTKTETILLNDIVGCRCMRSKRRSDSCACRPSVNGRSGLRVVEENSTDQDENDISAYLYIYAYVLKKYRVKSGHKRERMTITLRFRSFDRYEHNMKEAQRWRLAIKCLIRNKPIPRFILASDESMNMQLTEQSITEAVGEEKKLLILLSPKSGSGKAREVFQQRVVPVLAEAELPYELQVTKNANYARDFVRIRDIYQWRAIIVVAGDGVLFEVINGLLERPDWHKAIQIPLGVIPQGSGNGLAKSISYALGEPYDQNPVLISTLNIIKGKIAPMDLVRVETRSQTVFSFLSIGWGLLADIDIESERLRSIGGQRFTIWSVARLIGLRTYKGRLSYIPLSGYKAAKRDHAMMQNKQLKRSSTQAINGLAHPVSNGTYRSQSYHEDLSLNQDFRNHRIGSISSQSMCSVISSGDETGSILECSIGGDVDATLSDDETGRPRLDSFYSAVSKKSTYFSTAGSSYRSADGSSMVSWDNLARSNVRMYGPPSQLPALTQPVPSNWDVIEGEFVMVHASYQSHIGSDAFFAPNSKIDDGVIWLLVIKAGISRGQLLQFLLGLSSGTHLNSPTAEMIPVTAFRLEPQSAGGYLTVDGEVVDYGPIQAEVMPSLARILSR